jgi:ribonucleoside-diphosphate reductase alpha chain
VNLPESATVEDVEEMYVEGWKLGLKAIAIYRDNCKVAQPFVVEKKRAEPAATDEQAGMIRRRLPRQRPSQTWTRSRSRSRSGCSTACRWRPTSRSSRTCASSRPV